MFKKLFITSALLVLTSASNIAFANAAPYVAGSLGVVNEGGARGIPFTVAAGFGGVMQQNIYLAGEVFAVPATASINGAATSYGYGASIIPGVMLSDHTMAFVRAGVVRSHFKNQSANENGGQLGLGMQTSVTQGWDMRGEYVYTSYHHEHAKADQFNIGMVYKFG